MQLRPLDHPNYRSQARSDPEVNGPLQSTDDASYAFIDAGGHRRTQMRVAWWRSDADSWREAALSVPNPSTLPDAPLPPGVQAEIYPEDAPPVLVGHYKMTGAPRVEGTAACLDYPATPCVYRRRGEAVLEAANLMTV